MVDITEISAIVAAAGVLVGVVLTYAELRHQTKLRETDLLLRLGALADKEFSRDLDTIYSFEFPDHDDFVKRYGSRSITKEEKEFQEALDSVMNKAEIFGLLLRRGMLSADLAYEMFEGIRLWERVRPLVEGIRKHDNTPHLWEHFEYYYNEMKKREQRLEQRGA
jgi:hypothetical protein